MGGGGTISPVDLKKWQWPLSQVLKFSYQFQNGPMSPIDVEKHPMSCW